LTRRSPEFTSKANSRAAAGVQSIKRWRYASANRYWSADRLRYENAMLDDCFEKRIGKR
jgi:hypothetical protein